MFKQLIITTKKLSLTAFLFCVSTILIAQIKVINVEKTLVKEFEVNEKTTLSLQVNKAEVNFVTTTKKRLTITAVLSSKNSKIEQAEKDLLALKVEFSKNGNSISVVNYVQINSSDPKPTSNLKVIYTIEVPISSSPNIKVNNDFGKINSIGIKGDFTIESKFCIVSLTKHSGAIKLKDNFSMIDLNQINGDLVLKLERSALSITDQIGELEIKSSFSKLELTNLQPTSIVKIIDKHSQIDITQLCFECYTYNFNLEKSDLSVPNGVKPYYISNQLNQKVGVIRGSKSLTKTIDLASTSGIITLK